MKKPAAKKAKAKKAKVKKAKVKKAAVKKAAVKKTKAKKAKAKKKTTMPAGMAAAADGPTGCCTLTGSGPDIQREGLTREQCRILANSLDKNFQWVAGLCAEPD